MVLLRQKPQQPEEEPSLRVDPPGLTPFDE
jgi:hypothetical protein